MDLSITNPAIYFETKASQAGISLNLLCTEAGIARSTLTRWKSNSNGATTTRINKLETALNNLINKKSNRRTKATAELRQDI